MLTVAVSSSSSWRTDTLIVPDGVDTTRTISARIRSAIVNVNPAIRSCKPVCAFAQEPIHSVYAFPAVVTRLRTAIVHIVLAMVTFETVSTDALIVVSRIYTGSC